MKKIKFGLGVIIVVALILGGGYAYVHYNHASHQQTATSTPRKVEKKNVTLVALGDSLTHGQGDEDNQGGYVGIIKRQIEKKYTKTNVTAVNYGVTGDRSDQILTRLNQQKQLQSDLKKADVITMTVGGNDLMQTLEKNVLGSQSDVTNSVDQAGKTYQKKLTKLFTAVRKENPTAPIFVISIYNPFYAYFPDVTVINQSITKWNRLTKQSLAKYPHTHFVDINRLMTYGQYKTKAQRQQLVQEEKQANQGKVSQARVLKIMNNKDHNLNQYISTDDNFHPNHRGYVKIADQLFKAMTKYNSWEFIRR